MGEITQINSETLLDFIKRTGVVNAENVEMRFGMTNADARRALRDLVRAGKITESNDRKHRGDGVGGSRLEWRLAPDHSTKERDNA